MRAGTPPAEKRRNGGGIKKAPGCGHATRGFSVKISANGYAMASMIALKVALGRIAFDVLTGSGS
jgi:hypothetical protein